MDDLELTHQRDPHRPNLPQPFTTDELSGTLDEVAPEDPKDPLPSDKVVEPGIPAKNPSPDTTEPLIEEPDPEELLPVESPS